MVLAATSRTPGQEPTGLVRHALADTTFTWESAGDDTLRIYFQPGAFAGRHRAMLYRSVRASAERVWQLLGDDRFGGPLSVFYVESREEMDRLVGYPVTGFTDYSSGGVFLVVNPEWRSFEVHEITHALTLGTWGRPAPASRWMVEGICIYADGWCREYTVDQIAYHLLSGDELPPLEELFDGYRELGEIRGGMYAASVIGFIHERYGTPALHELWKAGSDALPDILGTDVRELETGWRRHLEQTVSPEVEVDYAAIDEKGCG